MTASTSAVRLTDQALTAVHVARAQAAQDGLRPNVAHLLLGLCTEPDGAAGMLLRREAPALAQRLSGHPGVSAPGLAPLAAAVLAAPVRLRPVWSDELLAATLRAGGAELIELLDDIGIHPPEVRISEDGQLPRVEDQEESGQPVETMGRGSLSRDGGATERADLAVARARARGTTVEALVEVLDGFGDAVELTALRGSAAGLDEVIRIALDAAALRGAALRGRGSPLDLDDLPRASLVATLHGSELRAEGT